MSAQDVALYYDELHRWTAKDEDFQAFSGRENDTIHRFLIDADTGAFSPTTIYKFVDPHIATQTPIRGLDAGSGYGGTCFRCLHVHGGEWTGITISPEQWENAKGIASARGFDDRIDFHLTSYDSALPGRFNVVVAIESLIHSPDPAHTVANLAAAIDPGGRMIIIDDMPVDDVPAADADTLAEFKRCWRAPVAPSATGWMAAADAAALRLVKREELSHLMKPRAEGDLDAAFADLWSQSGEKANAGFARLSDAEIGGLHLERLHRRGTVRYTMLVFEKA
jgi:SAM-dependent methyltransferase